MKKILFIAFLALSFANLYAQSELIVVRGETMDGKKIRVDYYKGKSKDLIEKVEYQVVEELNAQVKEYQQQINEYSKTVSDLKKDKKANESTIAKLNQRITALNDSLALMEQRCKEQQVNLELYRTQLKTYQSKDSVIDQMTSNDEEFLAVIDSLTKINEHLSREIANCSKNMSNLQTDLVTPRVAYSVGIDVGLGVSLFTNKMNDFWNKNNTSNQHISVYFQTGSLLNKLLLSVGIGVGFDNMPIKAQFNYYSVTIADMVDNDGDNYDLTMSYYDVKETGSLNYINIPVFVTIGQPYPNKLSLYAKLAIVPMINMNKTATFTGTYTSTGYYKQWDVTIHDIPELGFLTDEKFDEKVDLGVNTFVLSGSLSAGVYIPLCNLNKNPNGSNFVFKGGVRLDCTFIPIVKQVSNDFSESTIQYLGAHNSFENSNVISPIVEIGLVYLFKK